MKLSNLILMKNSITYNWIFTQNSKNNHGLILKFNTWIEYQWFILGIKSCETMSWKLFITHLCFYEPFLCMFECFKNTHLIKIQAIINNDCRTFSLPSLAKDHFESVSPKLVQQTTKVAQSPLAKTTLKFLIRVLHFLFFFWDFFLPTWPY